MDLEPVKFKIATNAMKRSLDDVKWSKHQGVSGLHISSLTIIICLKFYSFIKVQFL